MDINCFVSGDQYYVSTRTSSNTIILFPSKNIIAFLDPHYQIHVLTSVRVKSHGPVQPIQYKMGDVTLSTQCPSMWSNLFTHFSYLRVFEP